MKKFLVSLAAMTTIFSATAMADGDFGLEVGVRQQSGSVDSTTSSAKSEMGLQFGGTAAIPISGAWNFRTGMLYTQRNLTIETTAPVTKAKVSMSYLDIPVTIMYKFEDYAGVFAGVVAAMNLDHSVEGGGSLSGVKSMYMPIVIGATFKFAPQLGGTLYFENGSGEVAQGLKDYKAVGANLVITF